MWGTLGNEPFSKDLAGSSMRQEVPQWVDSWGTDLCVLLLQQPVATRLPSDRVLAMWQWAPGMVSDLRKNLKTERNPLTKQLHMVKSVVKETERP